MGIRVYSVAVTTTGTAGSAAGTGTVDIDAPGFLEWVYFDFHASAPGTTDVTVTMVNTPPGGTVATIGNTATDALQFPRASCVSTAGAAITDSNTKIALTSDLLVTVAQADALTACVTVYVAVSS